MPNSTLKGGEKENPICDFYGSSCFNSYIENGLAESCKNECFPGCNEVKYMVAKGEQHIDSSYVEKICNAVTKTVMCQKPEDTNTYLDLFENKLVEYIRHHKSSAIKRFQEALVNSSSPCMFLYRYCREKLQYDIAIIEVIMDSPTVMKFIQNLKVTLTDKLANFGEYDVILT